MSQIDVMCVGDLVTDAFIKLFDDQAEVQDTDRGPLLAIPFATKLPFEYAEVINAVGNSPNAAVNFASLGLNTALVSNVGSDTAGRDIIATLEKKKVNTEFVRINRGKVSNYHYVLWYKDERTILIKHEDYRYVWPRFTKRDIPKWMYFSSISEKALDMHDEIADWLDDNPEIKLAFQPGTFQMKAGAKRLKRIYKRCDIVACNREEAVFITGGNYDDMHDLFNKFHDMGCKIVVISDGPKGSYASDGENRYKMPLYPDPKPPLERTGAGDAFTSTFIAAMIKGNTIDGALQWAPISSMNVVQHVGAQAGLLSERELASLLRKAPDWYKPERI